MLDGGEIIGQAAVPVLAGDTLTSWLERVLKKEHILYPRAIRLVACQKVRLEEGTVKMDLESSEQLAISKLKMATEKPRSARKPGYKRQGCTQTQIN